jgi:hypothetical protein
LCFFAIAVLLGGKAILRVGPLHGGWTIGGVPHRSVPHGLRVIEEAFNVGKLWFARSDISGFFDGIPRDAVLAKIAKHVDDPAFLELLARATTVVLANERALGDDRRCFPTDKDGVAQGSPLSPLFGNILLHDFDHRLNDRGIVTPRFIDDFAIFGHSPSAVAKAFASARACLDALGLKCHDPFADGDRTKSAHGHASIGFDFLGYRIDRACSSPPPEPARSCSLPSTSSFALAGTPLARAFVSRIAWPIASGRPRLSTWSIAS